ncbi:ABC transporter permease [Brevibacterium otitidis]|uniref:ABC transporter permease n=1 Tax=Brevibacterium otitidis TaxID=53364 RepID=A0ABV5X268_9MICO|nr:ABC transporter permease subunit [Brevibacterium otitidis]
MAVITPVPEAPAGSRTPAPEAPAGFSATRALAWARWLPVIAVAAYVTIPLLCSIAYAVLPGGTFSLDAYSVLGADAKLTSAIVRTLLITAVTIVVLIAALVPAVVAVHLWAPRLRTVLEVLCTLPLVVPPIALAAGVVAMLRWGAQQGRGTTPNAISQFLQSPDLPLILVGTYVVLCLPFTFRSIDAGLRTIPLKAIVEGSQILGAGLWGTVWRVVLPNMRGSMLFSVFFATALCFGEFTVAATLNQQTVPVWLFTVSSTDFRASIAIAVLLNLITWALMLIATLTAAREARTRE